MRVTRQYIRKLISEYKKENLNEYSDYESHADLSDHMEDMFGMMEDVMTKYVDSGWLAGQDQASLSSDLEKLFNDMNMINNTFSQLAATGKVRR